MFISVDWTSVHADHNTFPEGMLKKYYSKYPSYCRCHLLCRAVIGRIRLPNWCPHSTLASCAVLLYMLWGGADLADTSLPSKRVWTTVASVSYSYTTCFLSMHGSTLLVEGA